MSSWETGDLIQMSDFLFLPNLYQHIHFELLNFELFFTEPQKLDLNIEFLLKKEFITDVENILCKESWKSDLYPTEENMEKLYPIIGIAVPGKGLYSLTKENIKLTPSNTLKGSVTHRIIVNPNQRGLVLGRKSPSDVNFLSVRNLFIFGNLFFDTPYTLEMKLFEVSEYLSDKDLLNTIIGLVIPFGNSKLITPTIIPPPGFSTTYVDNSTFSPIKSRYYPGESSKGLSFMPINGNEEVIMGKRIAFYNGMHNKDTLACIWGIDNMTESNIAISILDHDVFINPLLFSIFKKFYGNIAFPIHINVINFGDSKELTVKCTDLTSGKNWTENVVAPSKSEITIPLSVSELSKVKPGKKPIEIVVSDATNILYVKNIELNILPPDHLLLRIHDVGHSWYRDTLDAIVCWVNPNNKKIDELISDTRNRVGNDFFSSKKPVIAQIKALWDELKNRETSFEINSYSIGTSTRASYQRINPPENTLIKNKGNCLELTLIFASALEKLSLEPLIILVDEHAFLGCKIDDKNTVYLETTYIEYRSFGQALKKGREEYDTDGWKKEIVISDCRKKGLNPLF